MVFTGSTSRRAPTTWRFAAIVLVSALAFASACSRDDGEVQSGTSSTTTAPGDTATGGGATGAGDFGTLKAVCGPAEGKGTNGDAAQGVSSDSIKVGTISDPGFVGRPGLNQELFDASDVFVDWCNAAGGINGRKIDLTKRDAKLTEYKQRITESCAEDFALVGGGAVFDETGQEDLVVPEIHHGVADIREGEPFLDGIRVGQTWGTHWHGSLESDGFRRAFLREVAAAAGRRFVPDPHTSFAALREEQLDRLGDLIEQHADTDALWRLIESGAPQGLPFIPPGAPA
jgi:hypothetical protein